eukprot:gnl/Chilomastix_cuspidata/3692.p1 GENE.gnl/Chilomastix_cuspidata/3692~~gnl/Chilomastix_cuspidata/3692.p1  ORF type:complete len:1096 (+),score=276.72 gnl/Chilomastix_cuspidata/3692:81-3368(+)
MIPGLDSTDTGDFHRLVQRDKEIKKRLYNYWAEFSKHQRLESDTSVMWDTVSDSALEIHEKIALFHKDCDAFRMHNPAHAEFLRFYAESVLLLTGNERKADSLTRAARLLRDSPSGTEDEGADDFAPLDGRASTAPLVYDQIPASLAQRTQRFFQRNIILSVVPGCIFVLVSVFAFFFVRAQIPRLAENMRTAAAIATGTQQISSDVRSMQLAALDIFDAVEHDVGVESDWFLAFRAAVAAGTDVVSELHGNFTTQQTHLLPYEPDDTHGIFTVYAADGDTDPCPAPSDLPLDTMTEQFLACASDAAQLSAQEVADESAAPETFLCVLENAGISTELVTTVFTEDYRQTILNLSPLCLHGNVTNLLEKSALAWEGTLDNVSRHMYVFLFSVLGVIVVLHAAMTLPAAVSFSTHPHNAVQESRALVQNIPEATVQSILAFLRSQAGMPDGEAIDAHAALRRTFVVNRAYSVSNSSSLSTSESLDESDALLARRAREADQSPTRKERVFLKDIRWLLVLLDLLAIAFLVLQACALARLGAFGEERTREIYYAAQRAHIVEDIRFLVREVALDMTSFPPPDPYECGTDGRLRDASLAYESTCADSEWQVQYMRLMVLVKVELLSTLQTALRGGDELLGLPGSDKRDFPAQTYLLENATCTRLDMDPDTEPDTCHGSGMYPEHSYSFPQPVWPDEGLIGLQALLDEFQKAALMFYFPPRDREHFSAVRGIDNTLFSFVWDVGGVDIVQGVVQSTQCYADEIARDLARSTVLFCVFAVAEAAVLALFVLTGVRSMRLTTRALRKVAAVTLIFPRYFATQVFLRNPTLVQHFLRWQILPEETRGFNDVVVSTAQSIPYRSPLSPRLAATTIQSQTPAPHPLHIPRAQAPRRRTSSLDSSFGKSETTGSLSPARCFSQTSQTRTFLRPPEEHDASFFGARGSSVAAKPQTPLPGHRRQRSGLSAFVSSFHEPLALPARGVVTVAADGLVVAANERITELFGYKTLLGRDFSELFTVAPESEAALGGRALLGMPAEHFLVDTDGAQVCFLGLKRASNFFRFPCTIASLVADAGETQFILVEEPDALGGGGSRTDPYSDAAGLF